MQTIAFLDGAEQRCAAAHPLHEWTISLGLIDEQEMRALESFAQQQNAQAGKFQFIDPQDGVQYNNCSLALEVMDAIYDGSGRVRTTLMVRENPS